MTRRDNNGEVVGHDGEPWASAGLRPRLAIASAKLRGGETGRGQVVRVVLCSRRNLWHSRTGAPSHRHTFHIVIIRPVLVLCLSGPPKAPVFRTALCRPLRPNQITRAMPVC